MLRKLILFDCDETLWSSANANYIGSIISPLHVLEPGVIERVKDEAKFILKVGVAETFGLLARHSEIAVGIVSDNPRKPVVDALQLLGLWSVIDQRAVNVKLWQGYCPKQLIVQEIMMQPAFAHIPPNHIYMLDDKDYSKEMEEIGITFVQVSRATNMYKLVMDLL
jgi:predicted phosphatase